jgi:3-isopropylmalate dehydratase small subunit
MGIYFWQPEGLEDFASSAEPGDIIITGSNFGAGSSRQHAVDCFRSLKAGAIIARSFGAIYERNAINAGFPILTYDDISNLELISRDTVEIDLLKGSLTNKRNGRMAVVSKFSEIQKKIYLMGDLLGGIR